MTRNYTESNPKHELLEKLFSPFGGDRSPIVVYYIMYEWASKVAILAFNVANPLLVTSLGNLAFGGGNGKILWSYLSAAIYVITSLVYLSFTSILEYGDLRKKTMINCGLGSAICLVCFACCFNPFSIYFACFLAVVSRVLFNISNLAFESLLNSVAIGGRDAHQISSRSYLTGFVGMGFFLLLFLLPLYLVYYFTTFDKFVLERIVPVVEIGIWYFFFTLIVRNCFPPLVGLGLAFPVGGGPSEGPANSTSSTTIASRNPMMQASQSGSHNREAMTAALTAAAFTSSADKHSTESIQNHHQKRRSSVCTDTYNFLLLVKYGILHGSQMQWKCLWELQNFRDLCLFISSFMFINNAYNTACSARRVAMRLRYLEIRSVSLCGCLPFRLLKGLAEIL